MKRGRKKRPDGFTSCKVCGKVTYSYPSRPKKFCSSACYHNAKLARTHDVVNELKRCGRCRAWKPYSEFVKASKATRVGLHSYCKPCSSTWFHESRGTPEHRRKPYLPAYRLTEEEKKQSLLESSRRNHLRRRAAGKPPPRAELEALWCLQHGRCGYCQRFLGDIYHIDHKTPVARGGTNDLGNLHLTCPRCNMRKGAMTHDEFLTSKRRPVVAWEDA